MQGQRVVVTGLGLVSALGLSVKSTWESILAGRSGVSLIQGFDTENLPGRISASIKNFNSDLYFSPKDSRKMDLFIQYGMVAGIEAITDSAFEVTEENASRIGVAVGSGIGGLTTIEKTAQLLKESGPRKVSPFFIPSSIINMVSGQLSIRYGLRGPNISIVTACTTGTHNIGQAARMIAQGDADIMVTGGAEMATCPLGMAGFAACRALSTRNDDPTRASRPWDKDRDGFVLGDGAGILVLESYEHAKSRGAHMYAELLGFGMSADGYHITSPDPNGVGAALAMQNTLRDAHINSDQIEYINAHATSTVAGDEIEVKAIKKIFGSHAYNIAISSTKSMTGHLLGAAGAVEAIFSILALRDQVAPPTINLDNPDEGCDLDFVPHVARSLKLNYVLSNSFAFGGTNGSLLFSKI